MRRLNRLGVLAVAALLCATGSFGQEDSGDDPGSVANQAERQSGLEWGVGLRGSYASNSLIGGRPSLSITPEASLTLGGESSQTIWSSGGEIIVNGVNQARIADLHGGVENSFQLSTTTLLESSLTGSMTQADPDSSDLPANTLYAPLVFDGAVQGRVTQDFGRVDGRLTLDGEREFMTVTRLEDLSTIDNTSLNFWRGGATLRLGYEITPLLSAFAEGEVSAQKFDAVDPNVLAYLDNRRYELRGGLAYTQGTIISAEASLGRGWLDYVDASLTDRQSWVYNASLSFNPDETLSLTGALETTLGPSATVSGDTDVGYTLTGNVNYLVNPWVNLRGTAEWDYAYTIGTGDIASGYGFGAGLDYRGSRHMVWTADYTFARENTAPLNDTHTVMLGVRLTN